jgi:hypothetical protein
MPGEVKSFPQCPIPAAGIPVPLLSLLEKLNTLHARGCGGKDGITTKAAVVCLCLFWKNRSCKQRYFMTHGEVPGTVSFSYNDAKITAQYYGIF